MLDKIRLALDQSMRSYDQDGRMRVAVSHISKATVNPYRGNEIPGGEQLNLDPDKVYQLLRDPQELAKAAPSFNGIPLLDQHIPVSAADSQRDHIVGSTGTDAEFVAPYLNNSLVVWDDQAIAGIEHGVQCELSAAYHYDPDMTPGVFAGQRYDGVMRNLRGNHVALVEAGRAGSDVVVMDSAMDVDTDNGKDNNMRVQSLSPFQALIAGRAAGYLSTKLAQDQKLPDFSKIVAGVTVKDWDKQKPQIVAAIQRAVKGRLAQDAEVHIHEHLDGPENGAAPDLPPGKNGGDQNEPPQVALGTQGAAPAGEDHSDFDGIRDLLEQSGVDPAVIQQVMDALEQLLGGGNGNGNGEAATPPNGDEENCPPGQDEEGVVPKPDSPAMDRKLHAMRVAMDKKIKEAIEQTRATERNISEARNFIRPWAGEVSVAMDSDVEYYVFALETQGIDVSKVHKDAATLKTVLSMCPKPGEHAAAPRRAIAMDADEDKAYLERFPNANRLVHTR